jgi:hypothetical protein
MAWIGDAIASMLAQTHRDWMLVVVDDGSIDGTASAVAGIVDPRIRLIRQANAGVSVARNRGVEALVGGTPIPTLPRSAGEGVVFRPLSRGAGEGWGGGAALLFLDADDWLAPDALARLADSLASSPDAVGAIGPHTFVDTGGKRRPPSGDLLQRLLVRNLFANGGHLLLRADAVRAAGGFLPGIAYGEDWEFWIRIALQGPFASVPGNAPVLFIRRRATGAYLRLATNPDSFTPCMDAIFGNPALLACFGAARLAAIRKRAEAENAWVIGRELIRHREQRLGRAWLRQSFRAAPSAKRAGLLLAACLLRHGPFAPYAGAARENFACNVPTSPCGRKMMNTTSNEP